MPLSKAMLSALLLCCACSCAQGADIPGKAIYGKDDRQELFSTAGRWQEAGRSIAGKVALDHVLDGGGSFVELRGKPLRAKECPGNRFADQITVPSCTGFLAGSDLLVTAGHCIKTSEDCDGFVWVFGYALAKAGDQDYPKVVRDNVYRCRKVVARDFQDFGDVDYAILQLDRVAAGRKPLALGFDVPLEVGQALANIGHSNGLPLKFKDSARIKNIKPGRRAFESDLDTFGGDSGSPVFDAESGAVIGITSSGHADHYHDGVNTCRQLKVCGPGDKCHPATASSIANLKDEPSLMSRRGPPESNGHGRVTQ